MSFDTRVTRLVLAVLLVVPAGAVRIGAVTDPGAFTAFVAETLPQRALGDFDGDGRSDVAAIQDGADGPHVSVRLSGSHDTVYLEAAVAGLIDVDIDHDGDLDLVAATSSGDVKIWLNDGRGRFTYQEPSRSQRLSSETLNPEAQQNEPLALSGTPAPVLDARSAIVTAVVVSRIRQPNGPQPFTFDFLLFPSLRAPPLSISSV